ncbi:MAG: 16S rRNA (uracil(1498)-N(3))-methyltransferase [Nitrospirae bacterium]|nr:16S rRNA (uracil(1498)-N(3))-methyltransferase [Nitrospirota bacterium]
MPVYFIQSRSIQNDRVVLTGDLAHHLGAVLRCRVGEIVHLVDEDRVRYRSELSQIVEKRIIATILERERPVPRRIPAVTLAQAVLKGDKMDWAVQKAGELGVNVIIPVVTERTIARPRAERARHHRDRWQTIAKEASQQCGRLDYADVKPVVSLDDLFKNPPEASLKLVPWEQEQGRSLKAALQNLKEETSVAILIGPEGGFSPREIENAREAGWVSVSLGPRILRAETAGVAVLAIIEYELNEV